jgi:hypothetical protein
MLLKPVVFEEDKDLNLLLEELLNKYQSLGDRSNTLLSFEAYSRALPLLEYLNYYVSHFFTHSVKNLLDIIYYYNNKHLLEGEQMIPVSRYFREYDVLTFIWDLGTAELFSQDQLDEYTSVISDRRDMGEYAECLQVLQKLYPRVDFAKPFKLVLKMSTDPRLNITSYATEVLNCEHLEIL